jgi:Flp pilus assembly protein TadD
MADPEVSVQEIPTLEDLAREAESNPNELSIQCRYGWALFADEQYEEAQKIFSNASTRWPDEVEVQYALGLIYKDLGDPSSASGSFQKAGSGQAETIRQRMFQSMAEVQVGNLNRDA